MKKHIFLSSFLLFITLLPCSIKAVEVWYLEEMDLSSLSVERTVPFHTVYSSPEFFCKIYNSISDHFKDDRDLAFYNAAISGLLDEIVPLIAVVIDTNGRCCGYVTKICESIDIDLYAIRKRKQLNPRFFEKQNRDTLLAIQLFSRMQKITKKNDFCFVDLAPVNLGKIDDVCYLFDLDGLLKLSLLKKLITNWREELFYLDKKYRSTK